MHTNTLSPEHHTVKMWTPQEVSDASAVCLKLAGDMIKNHIGYDMTQRTVRVVNSLLDAARSGQMCYTYECLSLAERWMSETDKAHLNELFPELCNNRKVFSE